MLYYTVAFVILLTARCTQGAYFDEVVHNQKDFVEFLEYVGQITSKRVAKTMLKVDRRLYLHRTDYEQYPKKEPDHYADPANMQAFALGNLSSHLVEGNKVLDVASGSGYLAACMAYMVGETGLVVAQLPHEDDLLKASRNVHKNNFEVHNRITFVVGVTDDGEPLHAPYDAIHVGQIVERVPGKLLEQLKPGGRLLLPVAGTTAFRIYFYDKHENGTVSKTLKYTLPNEKQ